MAYSIYHANGTSVSVPDNAIDAAFYDPNLNGSGKGVGTQLIGQNAIDYGAPIAQNFLQLTENFCGPNLPSDSTTLQGQLWFKQLSSTSGNLYVKYKNLTSGGLTNYQQLVTADSTTGDVTVTGDLTVNGALNATTITGAASAVSGGAAHQILVQTAANTTGFISAPVSSNTYLKWTGSAFSWATAGGVSSVDASSDGTYSAALTITGGPITSSGTISITPNVFTSSTAGVVPGSGGGTTNFLRADGTWTTPAGAGTVTQVAVTSNGTYSSAITVGGSPITTNGTITITPNVFSSSAPGIVPSSGGGTTNFLRADGTWAAAGAGSVSSVDVSGGTTGLTTSGGPITSSGTITIGGTLNVSSGGTGRATIPTNSLILGNGTSAVSVVSVGASGTVLTGTSSAPAFSATPTLTSLSFSAGGGGVGGTGSGAVGVFNSSGLAVTGAITATGDITAFFSDRRLKENVRPISEALYKVNALSGITYTPNDLAASFGFNKSEKMVGLFADEVNAVLPEAVKSAPFDRDDEGNSKSGENYVTVQYEKLVPLLVEAIKELTDRLAQLERKVK